MKNLKLIALSTVLATALFVNGCSAGGGDKTTPVASQKTVTVQNADGSTFGTTCGDLVSSNGIEGMSLCQEGTNDIIGFIRTDATITGADGQVIGECAPDFDISQISEVDGHCGLSTTASNTQHGTTTDTSSSSNHNDTTSNTQHGTTTDTSSSSNHNDTTNEGSTSTNTTPSTPSTNGEIDFGNTDIVDGEVTTTQLDHPDTPQPTCANIQPNLLPPCTGAPGEVAAN